MQQDFHKLWWKTGIRDKEKITLDFGDNPDHVTSGSVVELRKNQWGGTTRRGAIGAEHRGAEGAEGGWGVGRGCPLPTGGWVWGGGYAASQKFFLILDHEIAFLAHSGRYILQFSCLLYAALR